MISQSITPLSTPPDPAVDDSEEYTAKASVTMQELPTMVGELNTAIGQFNETAAEVSDAAASVIAAAGAVGATAWNAATAYGAGDPVYSPINLQSYRRRTSGTSATDPANDPTNWARISLTSGDGDALALPQTLTNTSPTDITFTSAAAGRALTLPDATTCSEGVLGNYYNASRYDAPIRNSAGTLLGFIPPKSSVRVRLISNSTAAGTWVIDGVSYFGATGGGLVSPAVAMTPSATAVFMKVVAVDATRDLLLYMSGATLQAVCYDSAANTFGTVTLVRSSNVASYFIGVKVAADKVMVASCTPTTAVEAVVVSLVGTAITVNTVVTAVLAGNIVAMNDFLAVNAGFVLCYNRTGASNVFRAFTVLGNAVTIGAELAGVAGVAASFVSGNTLVNFSAAAALLTARCYTLAGTVLTPGVDATVVTTASAIHFARALTSGRWALGITNTTVYGVVATLAGATMTMNSVNLGLTVAPVFHNVVGNQVIVAAANLANALTDNAGVAVAGAAVALGAITLTTLSLLGTPATELWVYGSAASGTSRVFALGLNGNNASINAVSSERPDGDGVSSATSQELRHEADLYFQGTWGISLGSHSYAFDGTTLRTMKRPPWPLGFTVSGGTYPYESMTVLTVNASVSKSVKWCMQGETDGLINSMRITKLEAA